jgi:hypothetical protein
VVYIWNYRYFQPPPPLDSDAATPNLPAISILIPARNEQENIVDCLNCVLSSTAVDLEVVVLDDQSVDQTAELVQGFMQRDSRVRLITGQPLPPGWCGKQYACYQLAQSARNDYWAFIDADVRLHPEALARMIRFLEASGAGLVSGFPHQVTQTWLERLVLPLIHWILLGFLPLRWMRRRRWPGLGAGCGQFFLTTRKAYHQAGGHAVIRSSRHDGLTLPRAYRRAGLATDIADLTTLASCRMYHSAKQLWYGLAKNATEGMAHPTQIGVWTLVLLCGQVVPFLASGILIPMHISTALGTASLSVLPVWIFVSASILALWMRCDAAIRFQQSRWGAILHPCGILILLAIQWYALGRYLLGLPIKWRGR